MKIIEKCKLVIFSAIPKLSYCRIKLQTDCEMFQQVNDVKMLLVIWSVGCLRLHVSLFCFVCQLFSIIQGIIVTTVLPQTIHCEKHKSLGVNIGRLQKIDLSLTPIVFTLVTVVIKKQRNYILSSCSLLIFMIRGHHHSSRKRTKQSKKT